MFCDSCNDLVKVARPVTLTFADKTKAELNICLDCYAKETVKIPLSRRHRVAQILNRFKRLEP